MLYEEIEHIDYNRSNLRWNGWGAEDKDFYQLSKMDGIIEILKTELRMRVIPKTFSILLQDVRISKPRISPEKLNILGRIVGPKNVTFDHRERVFHSAGRSYYDVLRLRTNKLKNFVDAVVYPRNEKDIQALLKISQSSKMAIIPFGGGSSVVGGLEALRRKGHRCIISLDMTRLNRLLHFDPISNLATFEAGIYGPQIENILDQHGYTLGHFPQSFEYSTIGGWVAARSAGQQSNRYGKIEEILTSARMITPSGPIETLRVPAGATGPDMNQIIAGSEGLLGVITQVTVKIHPVPERREYFGVLFPDLTHALNFVRISAQEEHNLAMVRVSDSVETRMFLNLARLGKKRRIWNRITNVLQTGMLRIVGIGKDLCLVMVGIEGGEFEIGREEILIRKVIRDNKGFYIGTKAGKNWIKNRFNMPFLRNHVLNYGISVDTLETAVPYDRALDVHKNTIAAIKKEFPDSLAMCHVSHSYTDGVCLYFTVIFSTDLKEPIKQWNLLKRIASNTIIQNGGNISHHHGIGADHRLWYLKQSGKLIQDSLLAMKKRLDPSGILNPGKLFDN